MDYEASSDFRWEQLSEQEKQAMRAVMHARLTEPAHDTIDWLRDAFEAVPEEFHQIRVTMAVNPNTPAPVLHRLARSLHPIVPERVAENPRAHPATLESLAQHPHADVRAAVADNSNTPYHVMQRLASDESPDVRFRLAENHNLPEDILLLLSQDHNPYVACRAQRTLQRMQLQGGILL